MKLEVHPDETLVDQPLRTVVCKRERVSPPCAGTSTFVAAGTRRRHLHR
jgi:hypothetical protein